MNNNEIFLHDYDSAGDEAELRNKNYIKVVRKIRKGKVLLQICFLIAMWMKQEPAILLDVNRLTQKSTIIVKKQSFPRHDVLESGYSTVVCSC